MKIAFLYGPFSIGQRPIDFSALETSKRGLTGSELSCVEYARAMSKRGHDVTLFVAGCQPTTWEGIPVRPIQETQAIDQSWDAAYSWNEPDLLRHAHARLRMVNQQLNDFDYCHAGFDAFVDVYTSPSEIHRQYISQRMVPSKWTVQPNGCDPSQYTGKKIPGRVLYASSPDRGLHWLLQAWPKIKRLVPHASLRITYEMGPWFATFLGQEAFYVNGQLERGLTETGFRARYVALALERLRALDVVAVGSVSRRDMAREMSEAQCLAYPCDTIRFTEGFSVTTLEACASGAVPVVSSVDALGQIYEGLPTVIPAPIGTHLDEFATAVVRVLTDEDFRARSSAKGREIAQLHGWDLLSGRLEDLITAQLGAVHATCR